MYCPKGHDEQPDPGTNWDPLEQGITHKVREGEGEPKDVRESVTVNVVAVSFEARDSRTTGRENIAVPLMVETV